MKANPLRELAACGQSIWLDYISRDLIADGDLARLIDEDGLSGLTSNPTIFEKAIEKSSAYDGQVRELADSGRGVREIYEAVSIRDVCWAADEFRPVFDRTSGRDGYVSLEADPHLAHDTEATLREVRRLWGSLNRPNVLIKVPATDEGIPAIRQLISEGININITLLFGLPRYRQVAEAYIEGLEERAERGEPLAVYSVASFFVSRIDTKLDEKFQSYAGQCGEPAVLAGELYGQVAVSCAKMAYQMSREIFGSRRFWELSKDGASIQRLLWGSTGTKNPEFSDIKYVEELIGPDTINTVPLNTLAAYRGHGRPEVRIDQNVDHAAWALEVLPMLGISMDEITQQLEQEGAEKFSRSHDELLKTLEAAIEEKQRDAA